MNEPGHGEYVLAKTGPDEGILYQRDDIEGDGDTHWFSLTDPGDVVTWDNLLTDYDYLLAMHVGEHHINVRVERRDGIHP